MGHASLPPGEENPFQSPAPRLAGDARGEVRAGSPFAERKADAGFGGQLNRAFNAYMSQWSAWLVPMLLCAAIAVVCYLACLLPFLFAQGPLACGLYMCAFRNLRGWPVDSSDLNRGWQVFASAAWAGLAMVLLQMAPMVLFMAIALPVMVMLPGFQGPRKGPPAEGEFAIVLVFFAVEMIVMFAAMAWNFWINTRTMFVMPLIADRGYSVSMAFSESWRVTRVRFWERLLLSFLALLIGMLGMYACYVGMLFTLPIYFLIIAAAYEDEFGIESVPVGQAQPR